MSAKEIYAATPHEPRQSGRRFIIVLTLCILLFFGLTVGVMYAVMSAQLSRDAARQSAAQTATPTPPAEDYKWKIAGALTEACTCAVPCTCNFGEGPSPHSYCYPFYSYEIRQGNYGDVKLDGLRFGATDLKSGRTIFIDERANERQREALKLIAMQVIVRAPTENAEARAKEYESSTRYTAIAQDYGERGNRLKVEGIGEFSADYIMGLDKSAARHGAQQYYVAHTRRHQGQDQPLPRRGRARPHRR